MTDPYEFQKQIEKQISVIRKATHNLESQLGKVKKCKLKESHDEICQSCDGYKVFCENYITEVNK